ncbi:hypothetical protein LVK60_29440, partial [Escherichia coli]|nr:hypothetical protein [Escherichia coli]
TRRRISDIHKESVLSVKFNGGSAPPVVNNDIAVCSPGGISFFLEVRLMSALFKVNFVMR